LRAALIGKSILLDSQALTVESEWAKLRHDDLANAARVLLAQRTSVIKFDTPLRVYDTRGAEFATL